MHPRYQSGESGKGGLKRALYTLKRALYTLKRDTNTIKRALHTLKRALHTLTRALYTIIRDLYTIKRALYKFRRALHTLKRALFTLKRALHTHAMPIRREAFFVSKKNESLYTLDICDMTFTCDMTHSHVWHGSFIGLTRLIYVCDVTHLSVRHDPFMCVPWLIHMCNMTHSCACHDSFICASDTCDIEHTCHTVCSMSHVSDAHMNESWHAHEWVSHGTHMNDTVRRVTLNICMTCLTVCDTTLCILYIYIDVTSEQRCIRNRHGSFIRVIWHIRVYDMPHCARHDSCIFVTWSRKRASSD